MSIAQNSTQWVDSQVKRQIGSQSRKTTRQARLRRQGEQREQPLNVIGCLALIYAVRSLDAGNRPRLAVRRATAA